MLSDDTIRALVDRQLELEHKARAWDVVVALAREDSSMLLDGAHFKSWLDNVFAATRPRGAADLTAEPER